jgi:hypothetical protein
MFPNSVGMVEENAFLSRPMVPAIIKEREISNIQQLQPVLALLTQSFHLPHFTWQWTSQSVEAYAQ